MCVTTIAYVLAAGLEILGIGLVVFDVREDRRRSLELTRNYLQLSVSYTRSSADKALLIRPILGDDALRVMAKMTLENDRRLTAVELNSERADGVIRGVLNDMLSATLLRRLRGPILISVGIVLATAADIAASV